MTSTREAASETIIIMEIVAKYVNSSSRTGGEGRRIRRIRELPK
jgi:hypothetical protein